MICEEYVQVSRSCRRDISVDIDNLNFCKDQIEKEKGRKDYTGENILDFPDTYNS